MLILSTFNSDYLQKPFQSLKEHLPIKSFKIEYVEANLKQALLNLQTSEQKPNFCVILLRLSDLATNDLINIAEKLVELNNSESMSIIVFWCPSFNDNSLKFKDLINKFRQILQNKVYLITAEKICNEYSITSIQNTSGEKYHIPYTILFYCGIAALILKVVYILAPKPYKLIAADVDDTLIKGKAGEDGPNNITIEPHNRAIQQFLIDQQKQGKLIVLCSKNYEEVVYNVFNENKEMLLKKDHFIKKKNIEIDSKTKVFNKKYLGIEDCYNKINYEFKFENIKNISDELNISLDQILFLDDNEDELSQVEKKLPEVGCVKAPQNMEEFNKNLIFNSNQYAKVTDTDKKRTELYSNQMIMPSTSLKNYGIEEYSEDIKIFESNTEVIHLTPDHKEEIERLAELTQRCNQFNLYRLSKNKAEIEENVDNPRNVFFIIREKKNVLKELSEVGLGGALCILEKNYLLITGFVISCRAFTRKMGIENILIKHIANFAVEHNLETIKIKFKKTEKNIFASNFLDILIKNKFSQPEIYNINLLDQDEKEINFSSSRLKDLNVVGMTLSAYKHDQGKSIEHAEVNKSKLGKRNKYYKSIAIVQKYTESLDKLLNEFFFDIECLKSIESIETKVTLLCNKMLSKEAQDKSLIERGLDSIGATELRGYLISTNCTIENDSGQFEITYLLNPQTTASSLVTYLEELKKTSKKVAQKENIYEQGSVSFQQERLWLAEQQETSINSANFHMFACYKVSKQIDIKHFKLVFKQVIRLYDAFGTSFSLKDGKLKQFVSKPEERKLNFQVEDLGGRTLEEAIQDKISKPWTMQSKAPLIRIVIFEDNNYHIFIQPHHAIYDAISHKNCLDMVSKLYEHSLVSIFEFNDPPQYQQFINYQRRKFADEAYQSAAYNFWKNALSKIKTVTNLPNDLKVLSFKPAIKQTASRYRFSLSAKDLSNLKALAKANGVTCFAAVNALFGLLVAAYTFQKNITLITATNGRGGHSSFDKMVGFFVNILILQFDLDKNMLFDEYLKQVNKKFLDSYEFQDIPFSKIQEILQDQQIKDILTSPALVYQNYSIPTLKLNEEIAELELPEQPIIFDMRKTCRFGNFTLFAQENTQGLSFVVEYAKDLFSLTFIEAFGKNFLHTIKNVCRNPNQKLQNISVVCDEEREQLISLGQGPKLDFEEMSLVGKFLQNVDKYPENTALCCGEISLSYKELDHQSTNLARALTKAGVQSGNYVGIFLDPNHSFFIAELAILKIGAVFISLSKESPNERLKLIINAANIKFFIVDDDTRNLFDANFSAHLIPINAINKFVTLDEKIPNLVKTSNTFCVLYTSGSTGVPKGVFLPEKGILRVVESPNFIQVSREDKIAQTANQAFDAAQLECWLAWCHGASLILFDKATLLNINSFGKKLKDENITILWLTAGLFDAYANYQPDLFKSLNYLMVGGDVVQKKSILNVLSLEKHPNIINGYGPTETSIFALTHTFDKQTINNYNTTLIGSPINETAVEIRTPFASITPLGGIGELCISGNGVGSYLNSPKLNQEKFTENEGKRSYLTSDLVKYTTKNSEIMFIGRSNDDQVKINGYLVTLEEIRNCLSQYPLIPLEEEVTNCLLQYPLIKQVHVSISNSDGTNQLVAFYTLADKESIPPTKEEFDDYLSNFLEYYKFPSYYKRVDNFILNANGKVDTKQFIGIELKFNDSSEKIITTSTLYQQELLEIIRDCLVNTDNEKNEFKIRKALQNSFPDDIKFNIFRIVTDSIKKMEIINKFNAKFKLRFIEAYKEKQDEYRKEKLEKYLEKIYFTVNELFMNPTIEKLADLLTKKLNNDTKNETLRILKSGDNNLPSIVFIHPAGGGLSCFDKLIGQVKFDNICYGIEDPLLDSNQLKLLTMQEMARNYLSLIINEIQGSFILVGYSFGGMLALEMAAQNESTSENPQNLKFCCLIDTWVVSCISELKQNDLKREVLIYCKEQREKANFSENSSRILDALEKLCEHHQEIGFKFKPRKLTFTPVFLLKATILNDKFTEMHNQDENNLLLNFLDVEQFESRKINATHYDILEKVDENSLVELFSDKVNEFSPKKCLNNLDKKLGPVAKSKFFTTPLTAITNDSNFISTLRNQN